MPISEDDFKRLESCGMLYVILGEKAASNYAEYLEQEIGYKPILPTADMSRCPAMLSVKHHLGIRPKYIVNMERMQEIINAMSRYVSVGYKIPSEWFSELDDLNEILKDV
jgi:hypothetical protein